MLSISWFFHDFSMMNRLFSRFLSTVDSPGREEMDGVPQQLGRRLADFASSGVPGRWGMVGWIENDSLVYHNWLVVSNMTFFPFHIWDVIPTPLTKSYFSRW